MNRNLFVLGRKALAKGAVFVKMGYWHTGGERCCPDFPDDNFLNHLRVYRFAAQFCAGARVLDVGCGTGYGTAHLAGVAESAVGIDISRQAVRYAVKRFGSEKLAYKVMSAERLQFPDASFDFIISTENFEHLRDPVANLREMARVLAPAGLLLLATPNPEMFVGIYNPFHTHEFTYYELHSSVSEYFSEVVIAENQLEPSTAEGRRSRDLRRQAGAVGVDLVRHPVLFGASVDTTSLSNLRSFMCFARKPRPRG